jgi:hypothetical protein
MKDQDVAGLALFNRPYAWIGVERANGKTTLVQFDEQTNRTSRTALNVSRVWLRADCDFLTEKAQFSYSTDGRRFTKLGEPLTMVFQLTTFQGVRYALFNYNTSGERGGAADFDSFAVEQPFPRGLMRPIPYGERVRFTAKGQRYGLSTTQSGPAAAAPVAFEVLDMKLGRAALKSRHGFLAIGDNGEAHLTSEPPGESATFQWIETPTGELVLMSLRTNRFLRIDPRTQRIVADSPTPLPDNSDGVRFVWSLAK